MISKIKHLKVVEFEQKLTPTLKLPMIAMFNSSRINEETVKQLIASGGAEHNDFIVVMYKSQYENLYDLEETLKNEFYQDLLMEQREQM